MLDWTYSVFSQRVLSTLIGIVELSIAVLIALRPINPRLSLTGGILAFGLFMTTLSFLISTPGIVESSLGFPALSIMPGQFLLKDVVFLAVSFYVIVESLDKLNEL